MDNYCEIRESEVHGFGTFAIVVIPEGTKMGNIVERVNSKLTVTKFGVMINHGAQSNVKVIGFSEGAYIVATRDIQIDEEILGNYDDPDNPFYIKRNS